MVTTKVFNSGNSQAVRLPKEYRIDVEEVYITKSGSSIVLTPKAQMYDKFLEAINGFTDDFMSDGRGVQVLQERDWS